MKEPIDFAKKPAKISTDFELLDSDIKREYIISNIIIYNKIGELITECKGTFGTGYPFYALNSRMDSAFPIIEEQIRYNNELIEQTEQSSFKDWNCAQCLDERRFTMPDLKQICKVCPNMDDVLKPRKLINRLPDLDMWMIYEQKDFEQMKETVKESLAQNGFKTSDVDPVQTIYELEEIVNELKGGTISKKKLPIDTHLIDRLTIYTLISQVPDILDICHKNGNVPYLPIHPHSLRKDWQKDDEAYNFIFDYLFSFTEFTIDDEIQKLLNETRREVANKYSMETLKVFLDQVSSPGVKRRTRTARSRDNNDDRNIIEQLYEERMESWKQL